MKQQYGFLPRLAIFKGSDVVVHLNWVCDEKKTLFFLQFGSELRFAKN